MATTHTSTSSAYRGMIRTGREYTTASGQRYQVRQQAPIHTLDQDTVVQVAARWSDHLGRWMAPKPLQVPTYELVQA